MSSIEPAPKPKIMLPVLMAAGVSGTAGYVVLVLAARVLDPATNAAFLVYWGALFMAFGALVGVTAETTRAVFSGAGQPRPGTGGARSAHGSTLVLPVALTLGGGIALLVGGTGPVWAPHLFGDDWVALLGAMVIGIVLFTTHAALVGSAAGTSAWTPYSFLVGSEAVCRLVFCAVVALLGARLLGLAWAVALASGVWMIWLCTSSRYRALVGVRAQGDRAGLTWRMLVACSASGASGVLLVGYPVLLRMTTPTDVFAGAAPIVLSVSLSRAPLMVPLGVYQNVLVTKVINQGVRVLLPVLATLGAATLAGTVLAWLVGPGLLGLVNPTYHVSGSVLAALVLTAGLVALLTITGAATVALDHHAVYLAGWVTATMVCVLVLLVPGSLEARVVWSLVAGPLAGAAVHLQWGLRRNRAASHLRTVSP